MEVVGYLETVKRTSDPTGRKWKKFACAIDGTWYSCFINQDNQKNLESIEEGDSAKIIYDVSGDNGQYKNIKEIFKTKDTVFTTQHSTPTKEKAAQKAAPAAVEYATPAMAATKDFKITLASARNAAIAFVDLGIKHDCFNLGSKKADKADILLLLVNQYTNTFAKQILSTKEGDVMVESLQEVAKEETSVDRE